MLCLTATAKPEVVRDIREYRDHLRREEWEVVLPELTFGKENRGSAEPTLSS